MSFSILLTWMPLTLAGLTIAAAATLKAWNEWLALKRFELASSSRADPSASGMKHSELASLKERVRRLEAIANGVDPAA